MALIGEYLAAMLPSLDDVADPFSVYQDLLQREPLVSPDGLVVVLTQHAHCAAALRHPFAKVRRGLSPLSPRAGVSGFIFMDPPDHTRLRDLVSTAFTKRMIDNLQPWFEGQVHRVLDEAAHQESFDLIEQVAIPLPVAAISELLGVPTEERSAFSTWSQILASDFDDILRVLSREEQRRRRHALREFRAYLTALAEQRRRDPQDDLLSDLVLAGEQGDQLSNEELVRTVQLLLAAGHETTISAISSGTLLLIERPELRAPVGRDPVFAARFVEEVLRRHAPVQITLRIAAEDLSIDDVEVRAGAIMVVVLAAANLDPRRFPEPGVFDPSRHDSKRHLAFGGGIHFCLGAALARMEATTAVGAIARRVHGPVVVDPGIEFRPSVILRQIRRFPLAYDRIEARESELTVGLPQPTEAR